MFDRGRGKYLEVVLLVAIDRIKEKTRLLQSIRKRGRERGYCLFDVHHKSTPPLVVLYSHQEENNDRVEFKDSKILDGS